MFKLISFYFKSVIILSLLLNQAIASSILETAGYGSTRGGLAIGNSFLGARFSLSNTTLITEIGGQVQSWSDDSYPSNWDFDRSVFFALIQTEGDFLYPTDTQLSNPIFSEKVELSWSSGNYSIGNDTLINVNQILTPGEYAIIFGSGLFGATGTGWMPYTYSHIEENTPDLNYLSYQPHSNTEWQGLNENGIEYSPRFIVNGVTTVPEPLTYHLLLIGLFGFLFIRSREAKFMKS